jgi:predicted small secreted protein
MTRAILLAVLLSLMGLFALTGCETMEGMGEDVEGAGEEMDEAAEEAQDEEYEY